MTICPLGTEADIPLLDYAREHCGLVLSNDRFFDHASLRVEVLTLQFTLARLEFSPARETIRRDSSRLAEGWLAKRFSFIENLNCESFMIRF